jgi:hypothetical protein
MRYHLTPAGMAIIKKTNNNKHWQGCEEKGIPANCWWTYKLEQLLWKTVGKFLKKLKVEICAPIFIAILFRIVKK